MRTFLTLLAIASVWFWGFSVGRIERDVTAKKNAEKIAKLEALYR